MNGWVLLLVGILKGLILLLVHFSKHFRPLRLVLLCGLVGFVKLGVVFILTARFSHHLATVLMGSVRSKNSYPLWLSGVYHSQ